MASLLTHTPIPTCDLAAFSGRRNGSQSQPSILPHCVQGSPKGFKGQLPHPAPRPHLL